MTTSTGRAACALGRRGLHIFPCAPQDKVPLGHLVAHGCRDATNDATIIEKWWTEEPAANVAIATGHDGVFVIDVDIDEAKGIDGFASLAAIEDEHSELPETVIASTPRGGRHIYLRAPRGITIKNSTSKLAPGIDVRGHGGYVVAPPSVRPDGRYEWQTHNGTGIANAPGWLLSLLTDRPRKRAAPPPREERKDLGPYLRTALESEAQRVREATHGEGNDTLNKSAFNLGTLAHLGLTESDAEQALFDALATWTDPMPEGRARATFRSGWRAGEREPRSAPTPVSRGDRSSASSKRYFNTDVGNSERFADANGADLRFCYGAKSWIRWTGKQWAWNADGEVSRRAEAVVRGMLAEGSRRLSQAAGDETEEKQARALIAHAMASHRLARRNSMIEGARHRLEVLREEFDRDPWVLNYKGGTLDLRTGTSRPHRREDYLTKITPARFDVDAECPRWLSFLDRAMAGDEELVSFLQRAMGYSLTGSTREQCLFLLIGASGNNGKSVFLSTLAYVLGEYAVRTEFSTFLADRRHGDRNKGPDLERLVGVRFVCAAEPDASSSLDESLIKDLTGGEAIAVNPKYRDPYQFTPQCKVWLACNAPPRLPRGGRAMWRRLRVVPFGVEIPKRERDPELVEKLKAEAPGILAWGVEGCLGWQRQGLNPPSGVLAAEEDYRSDNDPLAGWLASCVVDVPGNAEILSTVHKSYLAWCEEHGVTHPVASRTLRQMLEERGYHAGRKERGRTIENVSVLTKPDGNAQSFSFPAHEGTFGENRQEPSGTLSDAPEWQEFQRGES